MWVTPPPPAGLWENQRSFPAPDFAPREIICSSLGYRRTPFKYFIYLSTVFPIILTMFGKTHNKESSVVQFRAPSIGWRVFSIYFSAWSYVCGIYEVPSVSAKTGYSTAIQLTMHFGWSISLYAQWGLAGAKLSDNSRSSFTFLHSPWRVCRFVLEKSRFFII